MIIYLLVALIVVQGILHHFERKDLYNRIMCKSINEYKHIDNPIRKSISGHERVLKKWRGEEE